MTPAWSARPDARGWSQSQASATGFFGIANIPNPTGRYVGLRISEHGPSRGAAGALLFLLFGVNFLLLSIRATLNRSLKGPRPKQKLDDVTLVRLQPVELDGRDGANV